MGCCKCLGSGCCSVVQLCLFAIPWTEVHQVLLSFTSSWSLLKFIFIESVMWSNQLILYCPLPFLPSIFSSIRVFSSQFFASGGQITGPSASASSLSNEYSGLISFRTDWFDLFTAQGTLKSLNQHCSSKASVLQCSVFMIQLTFICDYWKNHSFDSTELGWQSYVSAF